MVHISCFHCSHLFGLRRPISCFLLYSFTGFISQPKHETLICIILVCKNLNIQDLFTSIKFVIYINWVHVNSTRYRICLINSNSNLRSPIHDFIVHMNLGLYMDLEFNFTVHCSSKFGSITWFRFMFTLSYNFSTFYGK